MESYKRNALEETARDIGKDIYCFGKDFFVGAVNCVSAATLFPTFIRKDATMFKTKDADEDIEDYSDFFENGEFEGYSSFGNSLGWITAGIGGMAEVIYLSGFKEFPAWIIPLATNTLSGIYEIGREFYKKYKDHSESRKEIKNLPDSFRGPLEDLIEGYD